MAEGSDIICFEEEWNQQGRIRRVDGEIVSIEDWAQYYDEPPYFVMPRNAEIEWLAVPGERFLDGE